MDNYNTKYNNMDNKQCKFVKKLQFKQHTQCVIIIYVWKIEQIEINLQKEFLAVHIQSRTFENRRPVNVLLYLF